MDARTRLKTHPLRHRPRRLRHSTRLRAAVRETVLTPADFIYPMFIVHGTNVRDPIPSMPGICQLSVDQSVEEAKRAAAAGGSGGAALRHPRVEGSDRGGELRRRRHHPARGPRA